VRSLSRMDVPSDHWYPLLECHEVGRKPFGVERLGRRFVFWRSANGVLHAQPDRCPHLGAALSSGSIQDNHIVCPFHGFRFDATGQCTHVPAVGRNGRIPPGLAVRSFPVREAHGLVWLWWGDPQDATDALPYFAELEEGWSHHTITVDWPVHYTRAIENQLDSAHLPFVHRTTIGSSRRTVIEGPHVESGEAGIRVWVTSRSDDGKARSPAELAAAAAGTAPGLQLLYPGIWMLDLGPRLKNFIAFVPVNATTTRYYLRTYHRIRMRLLAWPFERLMGLSSRYILGQDKRVVLTQTPASSLDATEDRHIGADRAIVLYRKWHARALQQQG
jgi:phenylpropionate dioxygenase-like ring-hydroxylating dioxygenase large terminal subunit